MGEQLIAGAPFTPSENDYDWLGKGIYFWEANPLRGLRFAEELQTKRPSKRIDKPYVVGAVIDCGNCLDLLSSTGIEAVYQSYCDLKTMSYVANIEMPVNKKGDDLLLRYLDCAVINHLHELRSSAQQEPFSTVKGIFREGDPVYEGAGFFHKTHVQICVCDPSCIKGVFRVPGMHLGQDNSRERGYA